MFVDFEDSEDGMSISELGENYEAVELPSNHIRCAGHTMNLVCSTDTDSILSTDEVLHDAYTSMMDKCTALWDCYRTVTDCEIMDRHLGSRLARPVITRWTSLYNSLEAIYKLESKIGDDLYDELNFEEELRLEKEDFALLREYLFCFEDIMKDLVKLQVIIFFWQFSWKKIFIPIPCMYCYKNE